jgi:general secretion pathway protein N
MAGAALALVFFAPAAWLAGVVNNATGQRLMLADARGTVWAGSAVMVLTGGEGSRDASALPGRLQWTLGLDGAALALRARQACCISGELKLRIAPGFTRLKLELPAASGSTLVGQWPASWLIGLGTPWNTLQPSGTLQIASTGFVAEAVQGRWIFSGRLDVELRSLASSLSTLEELGSYKLTLQGDDKGDSAQLQLLTLGGPLQLQGNGQWVASKLRFNGQASAAPGSEAALSNLLNIIGRRRGELSIISIG